MIKRKAEKKVDVAPFKQNDPEVARRKAFAAAYEQRQRDASDERRLSLKSERANRPAGSTIDDPDRRRRLRDRRRFEPAKDTPFGYRNRPRDMVAYDEQNMGKFGNRRPRGSF